MLRRGLVAQSLIDDRVAEGFSVPQFGRRMASTWGEEPFDQIGLVLGSAELLSALTLLLVILLIFHGTVLQAAWKLAGRAPRAAGSERILLWNRVERMHRRLRWTVFILAPGAAMICLLMSPPEPFLGISLPSVVLAIWLCDLLLAAGGFLTLEMVRKKLGSRRV